MRVRVWETLTPQVQYEEGRYLATVLRRLGYDASVGLLPDVRFTPYTNDSRYHAQVISGGWDMDYPTASNMLVRLTCPYFIPANAATIDPSAFCDPAIDAQIKHATALQTTQPDKANALWAHVDREITNQAIWLPTVIPKTTDILSRRAGNYRYHLMLGALIDQLWIR